MSNFRLRIFGIPLAQGRARARPFIMGGKARVTMYDPEKSRDWKRTVAHEAALCRPAQLFSGPVSLEVWFYLPRPKSAPKRVTQHTTKPDYSNLVKGVEDALRGIVYHDDSQIVEARIAKHFADETNAPGVFIGVEELPGSGAGDLRRRAGRGRHGAAMAPGTPGRGRSEAPSVGAPSQGSQPKGQG